MPIIEIDDGTEIEFPDDMSGDEIKAVLNKQYGKAETQKETGNPLIKGAYNLVLKPVVDRVKAYQNPQMDLSEKIASDPTYRMFYGGVVEPVMGATQLLSKKVVDPIFGTNTGGAIDQLINRNQNIEQEGRKKSGEADPTGFDPYKLAGGLMVPLGIGSKANIAKTLLGRLALGVGTGGIFASLMPVYGEENQKNFDLKKGEQALGGMIVGGGIPLVSAAASKVGGFLKDQGDQLIRPFSEEGIKRDVKDLIVEQLGPQRARVIEAMMKANKGMTASQALAKYAQETGDVVGAPIMKLEKELSKKGGTGVPLRDTYQDQQQAREKIINRLAGTEDDISKQPLGETFTDQAGPGEFTGPLSDDLPKMLRPQSGAPSSYDAEMISDPLKRAKAIRSAKADELYKKAWDLPLEPDKEFTKIIENPYFRGMKKSISRLNEVEGVTPQSNLTKYLHNAKLSLDGLLEKQGESALSRAEKGKVAELKNQIVTYLGKRNKFYDDARKVFQEESGPINQMEVGRYLKEKLSSATGDEAPGTFLRAAKDAPKTLKDSTGFSRYEELSDVLNPEQVGDVNKVVNALERQAIAKKAGSQVESILPKLEAGIEITLPNMLSRPALVANAVLRTIGKNKSPEYNRVATEIMKNPQKLASLLKETGPVGQIAKQIYQDILPIMAGQTVGRAVGE